MSTKTQEILGFLPQTAGVPREELLVAADGSGNFRSITEALRAGAASQAPRIVVRPGLYRESLVIERPVELVADGPLGSVVVESDSGSCLLAYPQNAIVSGFVFRCTAGARRVECYGIEIQTRVFLNDCDISCDSLACLALYGPNADPIVRRCRIHHGAQAGVLIYQGGRGTFEECEFSENGLGAIEVRSASDPVVRQCRISGAVTVFVRGKGTFEACEITGAGPRGMAAFQVDSGDPVVRQCRIQNPAGAGVLVAGHGRGTFEDCEMVGNHLSGIEVKGAGNPVVRHCAIHDGAQGGVMISEWGRGTFEECEISGNTLSGLEIKEGADPLVLRCSIHHGKGDGVMVQKRGHGTLEECDIFANALAGVEIAGSADPVLRRCQIHHGMQGGVLAHTGGMGTLEECDIYADARCGVASFQKGDPILRRSKIHDCKEFGIIVFNEGTGTVEECEFWGHGGNNLSIRQGCQIMRRAIVEK